MRIPSADAPLQLVMPSWTPGSYLLREFPRNVQDFHVHDSTGLPVSWRKIDKNSWLVEAAEAPGPLTARYRVYANELTVRTSHLDSTHAYVNGASVFMFARGAEDEEIRLRVEQKHGWRVATSLAETEDGHFLAADYDELVDCPIEVGTYRTIVWEQSGLPHRYAIWGDAELDDTQLLADTRKIIDTCADMFGGLPYERYLFILHVVPEGRGGLEHKSSCSLQVPPSWTTGTEYENLIALVAHEFFHVWLGKRIRPDALGPFDYTAENYTRNLWVVEGFTTYYTDLILVRSGLISRSRYLERLSDSIARLQALPGRKHQTLEESSFDTWIKFYRPDAHTPNAQISYYQKGALVALALDLEIRRSSGGERSLDDVMRVLWDTYGSRDAGFPEDREAGIRKVVAEVGGETIAELLDRYVTTTQEIDFEAHLDAAGLTLGSQPVQDDAGSAEETASAQRPKPPAKGGAPSLTEIRLGLRLRESAAPPVKVTHVLEDSPAHRAGMNSGDELLAVGGRAATVAEVGRVLGQTEPGEPLDLIVSRRGRVIHLTALLLDIAYEPAKIVELSSSTAVQHQVLEGWLG